MIIMNYLKDAKCLGDKKLLNQSLRIELQNLQEWWNERLQMNRILLKLCNQRMRNSNFNLKIWNWKLRITDISLSSPNQ